MRARRIEFSKPIREQAWDRCGGTCEGCALRIQGRPEYDHIVPASLGGDATLGNVAVLCAKCHRRKTRRDRPRIDKARRVAERLAGLRKPSRIFPGSRADRYMKPMCGPARLRDGANR